MIKMKKTVHNTTTGADMLSVPTQIVPDNESSETKEIFTHIITLNLSKITFPEI